MFFFLSLLANFAFSQSCPKYQCGFSEPNTCVFFDSSSMTSTVQGCPSSSYCPFNYTNYNRSVQCQVNPKVQVYPGEKCSSTSECLYGNCSSKNHLCTGFALGQKCDNTLQCGEGLYCRSSSTSSISTCSKLLQPGDLGCTSSSDCSNLAFCNYSSTPENSKCLASLSFSPGTKVSKCYGGINYMCQYLKCVTIKSGSFCTSGVSSIKNLPVVCQENSDCISMSDPYIGGFFTENCTCGLNEFGKKYCPLFPGDVIYSNYIFFLSIWLNSDKITKCNSSRRMELPCIKSHLSEYEYNTLVYYMFMTNYYPYIQGNIFCVKEYINKVFWKSELYMASQEISSWSVSLMLSFLLYLV
jgi:hypothetical protein